MPIPDGVFYHSGELGAGTVASIQDTDPTNAETAGADINFGAGVVLSNGDIVPATSGAIYGVALKRTYIMGDHYTDLPNDHWTKGESVGVARAGTIAVPITQDVSRGDNAAVTTNGAFKVAGTSDKVVGVFLSDGNANGTANLQIAVALDSGVSSTGGSSSVSAPASSSSSSSSKKN